MTTNGTQDGAANGLLSGIPNGTSNVIHNVTPNGTTNGTQNHTSNGTLNDNLSATAEGIKLDDHVTIVGAGNFGASTSLWLAKLGVKNITLVDNTDFPNPRAASHDINKIVRDDYPDVLYMRMLKKAMLLWRTDQLLSPRYHQVGMLRADPTDFSVKSLTAYEAEGVNHNARFLTEDEVRQNWNGAFATTNIEGVDRVFYNPDVGFAEADKALGDVVQAAVDLGVKFIKGEMTTLTFDAEGNCTGIQLNDGRVLLADKVLLAAGARTAELLVQSAPDNKDLHAGDRLLATGAVSFYGKVEGETHEKLKDIPVFKNCLPQVKGEGMSILPDGTIKFNCDLCFTNYTTHPITGERMSMVPSSDEFNTWTGSKFLPYFMARARRTINGLYGDVARNVPILGYRMCWDASTPTHDFLITPHPHCQNLFIATGGSFHGWKFLPVIGEYVAAMMYGTLASDYANRWAWDKNRDSQDSANPTYQVIGDLKDLTQPEA